MAKVNKEEEKGLVHVTNAVDGIDVINQQIEALKFIRTTAYKTSGKYEGRDIKTITDPAQLIDIYSSISARVGAYDAAAKELGIKTYAAKTFDNGTVEQWKEDIQLQLQVIEYDSTLKNLEQIKKEYEELMDKEDRLKLLNNKVAKMFNAKKD